MTDWSKFSDRELDARAGLLAGTMKISASNSHKDKDQPFCIVSIAPACGMRGIIPDRPNVEHDYLVPEMTPYYSTDLNAARELEDELKRRGLQQVYAQELYRATVPRSDEPLCELMEWWYVARATARQRAEAFCAVMEASSAGGAQATPMFGQGAGDGPKGGEVGS
jgi:hypothetical protein